MWTLRADILDTYKNKERCVLLLGENGSDVQEANQVIQMDFVRRRQHLQNVDGFVDVVKRHSWCAITSFRGGDADGDGSGLGTLMQIAKPVQDHVLLYSAPEAPPDSALLEANWPVIWQQENERGGARRTLFCPKLGKPRMPSARHAGTCFGKNTCYYHDSRQGQRDRHWFRCPSPLAGGQVITLAGGAGLPMMILPKYFGRPSGYLYNLFHYFAYRFGFKPKIKVASVGYYISHNDTFSPGTRRMVRCPTNNVPHNKFRLSSQKVCPPLIFCSKI